MSKKKWKEWKKQNAITINVNKIIKLGRYIFNAEYVEVQILSKIKEDASVLIVKKDK